ncbi:MAG TPA: ROK family protein [Terriglobales bacterium]|nr:ROK family protein [Terriglobales bacterium]
MNRVLTVREKDKAVIMATVRQFGPISRVGIRNLTHIRQATISLLVNELLCEKQLKVVGHAANPTGRKQVMLSVNEESSFVIGLDFDEEFVDVALLDLHPKVKQSLREPTHLSSGLDGLLQQLFGCLQKLLKISRVNPAAIRGIGIGVPGLVNHRTGTVIMSSTIDFWKQIELKQIFEEKFGISTAVENNSRTKAIAERVLGAGEKAEDMIYAEYGKGIGSGIIVGERILRGHSYSGGELGHTHIVEDGPACKCGSFGCLEAIASITAIEGRLRKALAQGGYSRCLEFVQGDDSKLTGWTVLQGARAGDKLCIAIVEELGRHLGLALANLVNLFNPAVVVLDARLEMTGPELLQQIARIVRMQALTYATADLQFRFGKLGSSVGVLGAALLITEALFEIPVLKPPRFLLERDVPPPRSRVEHKIARTTTRTA